MRRSCDAAEEQLRITGEASKSLLDKAESLRQERFVTCSNENISVQQTKHPRREIEARSSIVTLFLARFTLTEAELEALTSRNVPVGESLFEAMDKADRIRDDCRVLMTGEDGPTKAGCDCLFSIMISCTKRRFLQKLGHHRHNVVPTGARIRKTV